MSVFFGTLLVMVGLGRAESLTDDSKQLVVCIAPTSSSYEGTLQLFRRGNDEKWMPDGKPWPVLFGTRGLAWGRGLNPPQPGPQKVGGDHKNPAGVFKIGQVLGYAARLPDGAKGWPYHQVTDHDAWIDDPKLTDLTYNHLYTLPSGQPYPAWWQQEHMHLGDAAYQWLVLIEHNYDHPDPVAGNEIFLHVRRGEHYRTAGCTTMDLPHLEQIVTWLDPDAKPLFVELPREDYLRLWKDWGLPAPEVAPH
jgi:hypothetical protein